MSRIKRTNEVDRPEQNTFMKSKDRDWLLKISTILKISYLQPVGSLTKHFYIFSLLFH